MRKPAEDLLKISAACMLAVLAYRPIFARTSVDGNAVAAVATQFETIYYSDSDPLLGSSLYHRLPEEDANFLSVPFEYLRVGLDSVRQGASKELLRGAAGLMIGTKDYHSPTGLGAVRSKFCYVVIDPTATDIANAFPELTRASQPDIPVWTWSANLREYGEKDKRSSTLYMAKPSSRYLLVCNDIDELRALAGRLETSENRNKVAPDIREWSSLNAGHVWAYRRYRHNDVDPVAAGTNAITSGAEALLFIVDLEKKISRLRLFAADEETARNLNQKRWKLGDWISVQPGAWETLIPFVANRDTSERLFDAMILLGFGVYT